MALFRQPSELSKVAVAPTINLYGARARTRAPRLLGLFYKSYRTTPTTLVHDVIQIHPRFASCSLGVVSLVFRSLSVTELKAKLQDLAPKKDSDPFILTSMVYQTNWA